MIKKYFFRAKGSKSNPFATKHYFFVHVKNSQIQWQKQASLKIITTYKNQPEIDNPNLNVLPMIVGKDVFCNPLVKR